MAEDFESKYFREIEAVKDLKKKIRSFESKCTKLSKRIDNLEIMGFQEQLNSLSDDLHKMKESILKTQIFIATELILLIANEAAEYVRLRKSKEFSNFKTDIGILTASTLAKLDTAKDVMPMYKEFKDKCVGMVNELGITYISVSP